MLLDSVGFWFRPDTTKDQERYSGSVATSLSEWVCVCVCVHACLLLNTQLYIFVCILFFSARTRIWMCDFPKCCLILVCGARAAGVSSSESLTNAEMLFFAFVKWIEQQQRCGRMDVWERAALFDVRVAPIFELFYLNLNVILKLIGLARRDDWNITTQSLWTNLKREKTQTRMMRMHCQRTKTEEVIGWERE